MSTVKDILFINRKSPLLQALDNKTINPFEYKLKNCISNGQKNFQYIVPITTNVSTSPYNDTYIFEITRNNGFLAQCIIECTITYDGLASQIQDRLGSRIFKSVELQTRAGQRSIQRIVPDYTNYRIDSLNYDNFKTIDQITNVQLVPGSSNKYIVYVPLFFQFSDGPETFFDTNSIEALQIKAIVSSTYLDMGLTQDLSIATFRLVSEYFTMSKPNIQVARNILSYDCDLEVPVPLPSGSSSITMPLTCKFTAMNISMVIRNTSQLYNRVLSFSLKSNNSDIIGTLDRRINFSLHSSYVGQGYASENNAFGTYTYWLSLNKTRSSQQLSLNIKDLEAPSLTVNYTTVPDATYSLYVFYECWRPMIIDKYGYIIQSSTN